MNRKPDSSPPEAAGGVAALPAGPRIAGARGRCLGPGLTTLVLLLAGAGAGEAQTRPPLRPVVEGCPVCELWEANEDMLLLTRQEIGRLPDGVIYLYSSDRPSVIEPLIRFAYQRADLDRAIAGDAALRDRIGGACGHNLSVTDPGYRAVISTSAHGFFAVLTSPNRTTVKLLHQDAQRSVRLSVHVRF